MPVHLVLYEPEIPPNTGNVARLCAAMGVPLHLIGPLGFSLDDKRLKRAGLDYWPEVDVQVWPGLAVYLDGAGRGRRLVAATAKRSRQITVLPQAVFTPEDSLLFGPETRGLPPHVLEQCGLRVHIPIRDCARSLNMSTAAGIVLYAALACLGELPRMQIAEDGV
ncbi:MAG: tRNA (cytidine(34)-2'-O)-methyltransferase [Deltaproteobacteria bacterium]|jgi:tRNA (cytidine/uridine-2'-O-)-methyltransferase|nr:tRNA (cytidine(34)-2'-O)-methyltransferase [Deltaproteobacteria bacterium]